MNRRFLIFFLMALLGRPAAAQTQAVPSVGGAEAGVAESPAEPVPSASETALVEFVGDVEVLKASGGAEQKVSAVPFALRPGDRVRTGGESAALIRLKDKSEIRVGPAASVTLGREEPAMVSVSLFLGKLWALVTKDQNRTFEVRTANAVAAVRGTSFSVEAADSHATTTEVFEGAVAVQGLKGGHAFGPESLVHPGQHLDAIRGVLHGIQSIVGPKMSPEELRKAFDEGKPLKDFGGKSPAKPGLQGQLDLWKREKTDARKLMDKWTVNREIGLQLHQKWLHGARALASASPTGSLLSGQVVLAGYQQLGLAGGQAGIGQLPTQFDSTRSQSSTSPFLQNPNYMTILYTPPPMAISGSCTYTCNGNICTCSILNMDIFLGN